MSEEPSERRGLDRPGPGERPTLEAAVALFAASRRALSRDVRTFSKGVLSRLRDRVQERLVRQARDGKGRVVFPADLLPEDLHDVLDEIARRGAPTPVVKAVYVLRQLGRFLLSGGYVLLDPARDLVRPRYVPRLGVVPRREEVARLLQAACPGEVLARAALGVPPRWARRRRWEAYDRRVTTERAEAGRDAALLELLYGSGLRFREAVELQVTDLNLAERTLFVARGKGGKTRVVPITVRARAALGAYLAEGRGVLLETRVRRRSTRRKAASHALFLSTTGGPLDPQGWRERRLAPLVAASRLAASLRPHRLRHACAVHLLESGADVLLIARLLGHARLETTALYLSLSTASLERTLLAAHPRERAPD